MKKYGALAALVVALLFGMLAVLLANKWLVSQGDSRKVVLKKEIPLSKVVVAAKDISLGNTLDGTNLALADWPKANRPPGAFTSIKDVQGRIAVTKLVAGEPLLSAELAPAGSGAGLVALIPSGMRAMAIKVDEVIGVGGFILPNTYVDVIAVELQQGKRDKVETILKRIKVLAIAQEPYTEDGKARVVRTVTLQVKPEQGERLALQTSKGRIHLVLRNPLEEEKVQVAAVKKEAPAPKKHLPVLKSRITVPRRSPFDVEVIRGSDREKLHFKDFQSADRV